MDMRLLAFLILVFCSGRANSVNVYFKSENFRNVLHWDPLDSPDNHTVVYSVEYNEYGHPFQPKKGCQNITTLSCDLTQETPLTKHLEKYAAQVMVGGKKIGQTRRFCPFSDSELGPPNVSVTLDASAMTVRVDLPLGPNNKSLGEIMPYPPFYTLILTYNASGETITQQYENNSSVFIISKLQSGTEYCGSVTYNSGHVNRREKSNATTFCKILPGDLEEASFLFLLPVGIVLLLLVVIPVVLWRILIVKKVAKPESLNITSNESPPIAANEKNNISRIVLQPQVTMAEVMSETVAKKKLESTGYAPQDNLAQPWHCQTYTTQQVAPPEESNDSALSSPNYCLVQVHSREDEDSPIVHSPGGGIFPMSNRPLAPVTGLPQSSEPDSGGPHSPEPEPLRLQFSSDGCLELPFLHQPSGLQGDRDPEVNTSEQTALLSDQPEAKGADDQGLFSPLLSGVIVYSPQGVSETYKTNSYISNEVVPQSPQGPTSYLPVQTHFSPLPMASGTHAAYRQNWVPQTVTESLTGPGVSLQSTCVNPSERENQGEGENEEDEEVTAGKGIFLKGWMLQIQT